MASKPHVTLAVLAYSLLIEIAWQILKPLTWFKSITPRQLRDRQIDKRDLVLLGSLRAKKRHAIIWFCSSAGEYEQAKPLIDKIAASGKEFQMLFFFSRSGYEFAKARNENIPFLMTPPDSVWRWQQLLTVLDPSACIVVRHELWPGFIYAASSCCPLLLINASSNKQLTRLLHLVRYHLLQRFTWIAAVDATDQKHIAACFAGAIDVTGDTKYERAIERAQQAAEKTSHQIIRDFAADKRLLIGGSVWPADADLILRAYEQLPDVSKSQWKILLAPHDISESAIADIEQRCATRGLTSTRWQPSAGQRTSPEAAKVLIINVMGKLAELYAVAELCLVGGAMHHKIHNVLEPACHGLFLAHGPCYTNSREAVMLVKNKLSLVVRGPSELASWWGHHAANPSRRNEALRQHVQAQTGAANRVYQKTLQFMATPAREQTP